MSIRISPRGGKWQYDIRFHWPDGSGRFRERANAPVTSKSAALRWAQAREAALLAGGSTGAAALPPAPTHSSAPTLAEFWPRVLSDHYRATRKKPSTIDAAEAIYRLHLAPRLGRKPLDEISDADVAALKGAYAASSRKTVNNILSVLSRVLGCAVKWKVLRERPCGCDLLSTTSTERAFYELEEYRRLVGASARLSTGHLCLVLLAGSAGLRRGEIVALKWSDLDMARRLVKVQRAIWRGHEETPKGGRGRVVPMTEELHAALTKHRHLRGERVVYSEKGRVLSNRTVRNWLGSALRKAGLIADDGPRDGAIHRLRHTFCSHLAAAGVPAKAIQELAGHADLTTTMRYMHLAPGDKDGAMSRLAGYYAGDTVTEGKRRTG